MFSVFLIYLIWWLSILLQHDFQKGKGFCLFPLCKYLLSVFWSGSPSVCFCAYFEVKNWSRWICWIIVLQCCPLGLFTHTALSSFDMLANTVQLRVKITARLKHLSLEAIRNTPWRLTLLTELILLCCWFCHLGIEPARVLLRSMRKQSRMQAVGWFQ